LAEREHADSIRVPVRPRRTALARSRLWRVAVGARFLLARQLGPAGGDTFA
jgi:hypothetical protein